MTRKADITLRPEHQLANLNIEQVAELFGDSTATIKRRMKKGMPYVLLPGSNRPRFSLAALVRWQKQFERNGDTGPDAEPLIGPEEVLRIVERVKTG